MDSELQALTALQQGAQEVKTPVGADTLRQVDLQQFRAFLKRKHEESGMTVSYDPLTSAQTTQTKAMENSGNLIGILIDRPVPTPPSTEKPFKAPPIGIEKVKRRTFGSSPGPSPLDTSERSRREAGRIGRLGRRGWLTDLCVSLIDFLHGWAKAWKAA